MISIPNNKAAILKVLEDNITKKGDCLIWTGESDDRDRYPRIKIANAFIAVIKLTYWRDKGYKPMWTLMKRTCNTPFCLNPDHHTDRTPEELKGYEPIAKQKTRCGYHMDEVFWEWNVMGMSLRAIADKIGTSPMTIKRAIERYRKSE